MQSGFTNCYELLFAFGVGLVCGVALQNKRPNVCHHNARGEQQHTLL